MREDRIRVLRIIEYDGPRSQVEALVARSIHGEKRIEGGQYHNTIIKVATIGTYPEILNDDKEVSDARCERI